MKRIVFLFCLSIFAIVKANDLPNILWLTMEDTSPQYIGCYGDSSAITPAIDSLASMGVRFTNSYSTGTVCSTSRSCIITGLRNGATGNGNHRSTYPLSDSVKGFPTYLRDAGYYTTNNSKTDYNTSDASRIISESWNESSNDAHWNKRDADQPFFSVLADRKMSLSHVSSLSANRSIEAFVIYPNPASESITIEAVNRILSVYLYDMMGKICLNDFPLEKTTTLDLNFFQKGLYVLNVKSQNDNYSQIISII